MPHKKKKEEEQTLRVLEPEGRRRRDEAPETDTPSLEEQLTLTRAELQKERHRYNSDLEGKTPSSDRSKSGTIR